MSDNDNLNETAASTDENTAAAPEVVEATETVAPNAQAQAAQQIAGNFVAKLLELKESNPKVFFGGIGGLVVVLLMLMMSGGDSNKKLPVRQVKDVTVGQTYVLSSPNAYDPAATVRLVTVPGSMAAYDDTEEADRNGACKHMPQNTRVKAKQLQGGGNQGTFVQVEMLDGECAGKDGWTLAINLQ